MMTVTYNITARVRPYQDALVPSSIKATSVTVYFQVSRSIHSINLHSTIQQ